MSEIIRPEQVNDDRLAALLKKRAKEKAGLFDEDALRNFRAVCRMSEAYKANGAEDARVVFWRKLLEISDDTVRAGLMIGVGIVGTVRQIKALLQALRTCPEAQQMFLRFWQEKALKNDAIDTGTETVDGGGGSAPEKAGDDDRGLDSPA